MKTNNPTGASELLPTLANCPFCGSDEIDFWQPSDNDNLYRANCWGCAANTEYESTPEKAAERWNTRPTVPVNRNGRYAKCFERIAKAIGITTILLTAEAENDEESTAESVTRLVEKFAARPTPPPAAPSIAEGVKGPVEWEAGVVWNPDGDAVCYVNEQAVGEQIVTALNSHASLLAEVAAYKAMTDVANDITGFGWHVQRRRENDKFEWFSKNADSVYGPFDTPLSAWLALKGEGE